MSELDSDLADILLGVGLLLGPLLFYRIYLTVTASWSKDSAEGWLEENLDKIIAVLAVVFVVVFIAAVAIGPEEVSTAWMHTPVKPDAYPVQGTR